MFVALIRFFNKRMVKMSGENAMANWAQVERLWQGAVSWNEWRREHPETRIDFSLADLRDADLSGADLSGANFDSTDLSCVSIVGANLNGANLSGADLCSADLSHADLRGADLCETDLRGAKLFKTDLSGVDLRLAILKRANVVDANLSGAILCGVNLNGADLRSSHLRNADLRNVNLSGANLRCADLRGANLSEALQPHLFGATLSCELFREGYCSVHQRARGVRLEGGRHLFQVGKSQTFRIAQAVGVAVPMDAAIGHPTGTAPRAGGAQTSLLS